MFHSEQKYLPTKKHTSLSRNYPHRQPGSLWNAFPSAKPIIPVNYLEIATAKFLT